MTTIVIAAGGTGGHVFPALAVADYLRSKGVDVVWLGTRQGLEARVVPAAGFPVEWITIRGLRRRGLIDWLLLPFRLVRAMTQALRVLRRCHPRALLAMGGFVAGPGGLVAAALRIPVIVHEQNAVAGLTNRWLALVADQVLCGFPDAFPHRPGARHVGNPVRMPILHLPPPTERARSHSGWRVLVVGGSQGAQVFNRVLPAAFALLTPAEQPEIWHQTGQRQHAETEQAYRAAGVTARVTPFIEDMAQAYAWADLVVCRAGAMTVAELAAAGVASILVPFPFATDDHQTANARFLADREAAILVPEHEFEVAHIAELLRGFAHRHDVLLQMAQHARACAMPDATVMVARLCLEAMHA